MPKFQGATYFTMKGGLNTEASPLNIPPSDATEICNLDINIDGSFERRRGMNIFSDALYPLNPIFPSDKPPFPTTVQFDATDILGNIKKYVIIHLENRFLIYDYSSPETLTTLSTPTSTIVAQYEEPYKEPEESGPFYSPEIYPYKSIYLKDHNKLFILNKKLPLAYLEYVPDTDSFRLIALKTEYRKIDTEAKTAEITPIQDKLDGWEVGCLAGSRLWLAGINGKPNTLYFSQTIIEGGNYGKMYQEADPFDVLDNILVDTDGGSIQLMGAGKILALTPLGAGVIVFTTSGVWSIGGQDGFRPTNYSINKISDVAIIGRDAWCAVEQQLVFFGDSNIYTVLLGTSIDTPEVQVIGDKILSFYNSIPVYNRRHSKVIYNTVLKKIYFLTNFKEYGWHILSNQSVHYRDALVMDVRLAAWTKYSLADDPVGEDLHIADIVTFDNGVPTLGVVTDLSVPVTDDEEAVLTQNLEATGNTINTHLLYIKKESTSFVIYMGLLQGGSPIDFYGNIEFEVDNRSCVTIAHQTFNDLAHRKFAPYIIPIFKRMESDELADGVDRTPGGCLYRIDWDWSINSNSKKYGELRQAYFPYRFTKSRFDGVNPGVDIITSRLKMRGRGEVFRLHFESEPGKDFKMYGWQIMLHAKGRI